MYVENSTLYFHRCEIWTGCMTIMFMKPWCYSKGKTKKSSDFCPPESKKKNNMGVTVVKSSQKSLEVWLTHQIED